VGEFFVILGTIKVDFWLAALAATTLIFGAAYTLWMVKRVIFGAVANENVAALKDVGRRELVFLGVLAIAVLWVGIDPKPLGDVMNPSIHALLEHVSQSKAQ
jgi:NADH-quinone oxidoreductase subunit M